VEWLALACEDRRVNEVELRRAIYAHFRLTGRAPTAEGLGVDAAALQRLAAAHAVVLDDAGGIGFANPFAAPGAPYRATTREGVWSAVCAWDAFGILAALDADGTVSGSCPDCREAIEVEVSRGRVAGDDVVAHFLVPAAEWYADLAFT
jgi:hypothetical protein